jgi:acetyl-CoA C-acetyltransferase
MARARPSSRRATFPAPFPRPTLPPRPAARCLRVSLSRRRTSTKSSSAAPARAPDEVNIGRVIALRLGCGHKVPGWTVMRNCASGMQALDSAIANIHSGRSQLVLAGGVDALSRAPLLFSDKMVRWFAGWMAARTTGEAGDARQAASAMLSGPGDRHHEGPHRPGGRPDDGPDRREPGLEVRHHASRWMPFRSTATESVSVAQDAGRFEEIVPLIDANGKVYAADDGVRHDSSMEGLGKLKPFFDRKYGKITPGNSSQITDGAAWLLLASAEAVEKYTAHADRAHHRQPMGRPRSGADGPRSRACRDAHPAAPRAGPERPRRLGNQRSLRRPGHRLHQGLGRPGLLPEQLGLDGALGTLDAAKLNVDGGAIALGHPVGASGCAHRAAPAARAAPGGKRNAAWPASASAAARAGPCWWRHCNEPEELETRTRSRWRGLGHPRHRGLLDQHTGRGSDERTRPDARRMREAARRKA